MFYSFCIVDLLINLLRCEEVQLDLVTKTLTSWSTMLDDDYAMWVAGSDSILTSCSAKKNL